MADYLKPGVTDAQVIADIASWIRNAQVGVTEEPQQQALQDASGRKVLLGFAVLTPSCAGS